MYRILGWINVSIVAIMLTPFALPYLSKNLLRKHKESIQESYKVLRTVHKLLGGILFISAIVHGYLALMAFALHTGTILGILTVIVVSFGGLFRFIKKKWVRTTHKVLAFIMILVLCLHLIFPSAIYYLMN